MKIRVWIKRIFITMVILVLLLLATIFGSYYWIKYSTAEHITPNIQQVEPHKTALVLGTASRVPGGRTNLFFKYRMEAVKRLFDAKKIKYVIVSGDNSILEYNEARDMTNYLVNLGIPEERIIQDFAGFRTLDSVIRAKEVFGQESFIVVSQPFHNERAVFIARNYGIDAVGYNAKAVSTRYSLKTHLREYLARVKCVLDVYIFRTMPKYYKEKEVFPE